MTNYDGSQDEGAERANDQVLTEFLFRAVRPMVCLPTVNVFT